MKIFSLTVCTLFVAISISCKSPKAQSTPSFTAGQVWHDPVSNMDFCWIPPGTFTMGSPDNEAGRENDEGPQHNVIIRKGFWLGRTAVTQRQYQAVVGSNPSHFQNVGPDAPVELVSWDDAQGFLRKLNVKVGSTVYRLPTEAEWEYACRSGSVTALYTGPMTFQGKYIGLELDPISWYYRNSRMTTHPVGQKQPNAFGLYDMLGNVWQWCQDKYGEYHSGNTQDPQGPSAGAYRVARGGSWLYDAGYLRSATRNHYDQDFQFKDLGFRVVAISQTPAQTQ